MSFTSKTKDPDAILDYQWADDGWLVDDDTITDADFTVYAGDGGALDTDDDAPVTVDTSSFTDTTATAWISGGQTQYSPYLVTCHIVTAAGREDDKTLKLTIKQK